MELGDERNLSDQRKESKGKCFGISKGALIGIKMISCLQALHEKGYIHRDIKPSNFVYCYKYSKDIMKLLVYEVVHAMKKQYKLSYSVPDYIIKISIKDH